MNSNILIDALPDTVEVNGRALPIRTDYRVGILFELLLDDRALSARDKIIAALELWFYELPSETDEAFRGAMGFYLCGKTPKDQPNAAASKGIAPKIYSFQHDADLILAAFQSQYGIDLTSVENLHWWRFRALFNGLSGTTEIMKIMGYRAVDLSSVKDLHERERLSRLKAAYALPSPLNDEEQAGQIGCLLAGGLS